MYLYKEMHAAGSNCDKKVLKELESALKQWLSVIPEHCKLIVVLRSTPYTDKYL